MALLRQQRQQQQQPQQQMQQQQQEQQQMQQQQQSLGGTIAGLPWSTILTGTVNQLLSTVLYKWAMFNNFRRGSHQGAILDIQRPS
jgi:hypothetical protein